MNISRRALLGGLVLTALGCDAMKGCDDPSQPGVPGADDMDPGAVVKAASPIGYSNVATLNKEEAKAILGEGLTLLQAELTPFDQVPNLKLHLPRIASAVEVARAHSAVVLITVVNWNGRAQRAMGDAAYLAMIDAVAQQIGPTGVWLEGVSEPDSSAQAVRWQRWAVEKWPGVRVVNGPGGRGNAVVSGDFLDWHHCSYASLLDGVRKRALLHSTDCTPLLASAMSPAQVTEVTREAAKLKRALILYDTFNAPAANLNVARWMGAALQE